MILISKGFNDLFKKDCLNSELSPECSWSLSSSTCPVGSRFRQTVKTGKTEVKCITYQEIDAEKVVRDAIMCA